MKDQNKQRKKKPIFKGKQCYNKDICMCVFKYLQRISRCSRNSRSSNYLTQGQRIRKEEESIKKKVLLKLKYQC